MAYKVKIFNLDGSLFGVENRPTKEYLEQSKRFWKHAGKRIEVSGSATPLPKMWSDEKFDRLMGLNSNVRINIKTGMDREFTKKYTLKQLLRELN